MRWLQKEVRGFALIRLILYGTAFNFLYLVVVATIWRHFHISVGSGFTRETIVQWYFPVFLMAAAMTEELLYRVPLSLIRWFFNPRPVVIILSAIILSFRFGLDHSLATVYLQGVYGLVWSVIFLKAGGWSGRLDKPWMVSGLAHFLFNATLSLLVVLRLIT